MKGLGNLSLKFNKAFNRSLSLIKIFQIDALHSHYMKMTSCRSLQVCVRCTNKFFFNGSICVLSKNGIIL